MKTGVTYRLLVKKGYRLFTAKHKQLPGLFIFLLLLSPVKFYAQLSIALNTPVVNSNFNKDLTTDPEITEFDEITISLQVPRLGSIEIPALIVNEKAYLPVKELFDFLKIKNTPADDFRSIEGFLIDPAAVYKIDKLEHLITYQNKNIELQPSDIICIASGMYLKSDIFGKVFGLNCEFSFRSLSVKLITNLELPAFREMKMEAMYKNLNNLKGERIVDTVIKRKFSLFRLGMLDWGVVSTSQKFNQRDARISLGLGSIIAGGETNMLLNLFTNQPIKMRDQYYFWRYVNNETKAIRQVTLGKILANPSSTISDGIIGVQINNTPTTFRRSFGTYMISNKTEPGWMVELYVNNVLLNFTRADASGFFTFEVPMVYGNSVVRLRFYGPWGEEQTREQNLSIPFNFLPAKQFEYSLNAGIVEDGLKSKFSRAQFGYGLSKKITIGAGMEYLSSVSQKMMPFVSASIRVGSNMFISAEHMKGVRSSGVISYRFPSDLRVEMNYLRYEKGQRAIQINFLDERKLVISKPFKGDKFSLFSRLTINQFRMSNLPKQAKYTTTELLLSGVAFGISSNLTNFIIMNQAGIPLAYSNLFITFRLPHGINLLPQVQYEYSSNKFSFIKAEIEKTIFKKGFLNLSYQWDIKNNDYIASIGLRYNFSFAQTFSSVRKSKQHTTYNEMIRGSMMYNSKSKLLKTNDQNNVGRGGLIVAAYLDLNNNGKRDKGEPAADGLKMRINGGRVEKNKNDTTLYVTGLNAYTNYFIELDKSSFDNISWRIAKSTMRIAVEPNHFTLLEIPVSVVGEVTGTVYFKDDKGSNGIGRIIVNIYNSKSEQVARTITEADGYFSYIGLQPGQYTVMVDSEQLKKLNMQSSSGSLQVELLKEIDGDTVSGIVFVLNNKE